MWAGVTVMSFLGLYKVYQGRVEAKRLHGERRALRLCLLPMLAGEEDRRRYLEELHFKRMEAAIMKDDPSFVPGESTYHNPKFDSVRIVAPDIQPPMLFADSPPCCFPLSDHHTRSGTTRSKAFATWPRNNTSPSLPPPNRNGQITIVIQFAV
jgi:GRIM-19 protein